MLAFFQQLHELPTPSVSLVLTLCVSHSVDVTQRNSGFAVTSVTWCLGQDKE